MSFTPRLTAPTDFSTYYGSWNTYNRFPRDYGNCTWYAYGRTGEIAGQNIYNDFYITQPPGNGKDWIYNTWPQYTITPDDPLEIKLGDILVWGGGTYGHVEVVEQILNNTYTISYSIAGDTEASSLYWGIRYLPRSLAWGDYLGQVEHNDGSTAYLYNTLIGVIHNKYASEDPPVPPTPSNIFLPFKRRRNMRVLIRR